MRITEGFTMCQVAGKTVAVASGALAKRFNGMITLNGSAKLLFEKLQKETTLEELTQVLVNEYGISEETAAADAGKFVSGLREKGLLVE